MSIIQLINLNLMYDINNEKRFKDIFVPNKSLKNHLSRPQRIHALRDISLSIKDGDKLGIIGYNGAGKSSLLKVIAGIYPPTSGELYVEGRIASLFELATGFEMEANGWDNIYLRGLMLGETPKSIKAKMSEIAKFSELGDHLNVPVKYYSSGMFMRLAFSISTAIEPDILLLDEVVGAGDARFLDKAKQRINSLMDRVKILVFVTHSMTSLKDFCNKCIWLDAGSIKMSGTPEEVSKCYFVYK
ncbi:ABC transporter ATP-binding protein [Desulfitibacter alkalitolerans]|uniref:ABC transporter ATP-binding protein n=1 Tax=Desulfitibacter alkalitolerans TaxID=264641 RepID=UPI0004867335|nr:ABC transporter ATP-binding protein [Desulfitibacter alkalitolerans]